MARFSSASKLNDVYVNTNYPSPPFYESVDLYKFRMRYCDYVAYHFREAQLPIPDLKLIDMYIEPKLDNLSLAYIINTHDRILVSGVGKTTLLRYIAYALGNNQITVLANNIGRLLPIPINLSNSTETINNFSDWISIFQRQIGIKIDVEMIKFYLLQKWGVFLFDDVKHDDLELISSLIKEFPDNKFILTSNHNIEGFSRFDIQLDQQHIDSFAKRWFSRYETIPKGFMSAIQGIYDIEYIIKLAMVYEHKNFINYWCKLPPNMQQSILQDYNKIEG